MYGFSVIVSAPQSTTIKTINKNIQIKTKHSNSPSVNILSLKAAHTLSPFSTTQTYTCTFEHNEYMCGM